MNNFVPKTLAKQWGLKPDTIAFLIDETSALHLFQAEHFEKFLMNGHADGLILELKIFM